MILAHLKSVFTLCPTGQQNFCLKGANGPEHRGPEIRIEVHAVRAAARTVVRTIVTAAEVAAEDPRGRQNAPNGCNWIPAMQPIPNFLIGNLV